MKRYYKITFAASMFGLLLISFQNCGKSNVGSSSAESQEVFVHFDDTQNTKYDIVHSDCSDEVCLFTLYSLENTNTPINSKTKMPKRASTKTRDHSADPYPAVEYDMKSETTQTERDHSSDPYPAVEYDMKSNSELAFEGIYCDVLQESGYGDIYVSCPKEVQDDSGFYIKISK